MTDRTKPEAPVGGPLGDTGDGDTGVPEFEETTNRPGHRAEDVDVKYDNIEPAPTDGGADMELKELEQDAADEVDEDLEVPVDDGDDAEDEVPGTGADDAE